MDVKCPICRWTPKVSQASYDQHIEVMINVASGRIYEKSSKDEKARAWVKEGLELFNASFDEPTDNPDECEAAQLAQQFMMETDDEEEDEEEEQDEAVEM